LASAILAVFIGSHSSWSDYSSPTSSLYEKISC
jgi:hypothetical protein